MNETPDHLFKQLPAVFAMLAIFIFMGVVGNTIVILVYVKRPHQQSATFFIIVLACVDIFCCVVNIPFTIAIETMKFKMHSIALCRAYYFLYISSLPFSSLLISAIAVDRYLYICYPMKRVMTTRKAKLVTMSLLVFAMLVGLGAIFTVRLTYPDTDLASNSTMENTTLDTTVDEEVDLTPICEEIGYVKNTTDLERTLHLIVQQMNHGCYWFSIVCVTTLYGLIFVTVIRLRRKRVIRLTLAHQSRVSMSAGQMRNLDDSLPVSDRLHPPGGSVRAQPRRQSSITSNPSTGRRTRRQSNPEGSQRTSETGPDPGPTQDGDTKPRSNGRRSLLTRTSTDMGARPSVNRLISRHMLQTVKSAAILFVVSVVFILTCLPALLMANEKIGMNLVIFYLVYANHATNPLIYCFMNRSFREDLMSIIRRRMLHRRSFL